MTDQQYLITEAQRDEQIEIMRRNMQDPDAYDAIAMLQSLPVVSAEPVAWTWDTMGSGGMSGYRMAHFQMNKPEKTATMFDLTPLYTSPQASTPITAKDVTDEMLRVFLDELDTPMNYRATVAAAYNAFINHRNIK